jgi:hypothetical protein
MWVTVLLDSVKQALEIANVRSSLFQKCFISACLPPSFNSP